MAKPSRKPSFVHYGEGDQEICVGEFHYGSAADPKVLGPGKGIKTFLTDPPYNLGFDYGPEVNDKQPEEDYHQMMEDIVDACYEAADDDAHLFMIHYPQDFAKMWGRLTKKWKFHQWITWAYPANFGHSTKKWTNASRTILWLVKGDPEFYGERVVQPYRNPTDRRIKKLIHEEGKMGTNLYNWWTVNLCKNVSRDKREYSNQIPEELLERIILSSTNAGDMVADPFSGTFSTSRTAMKLGRRAWGCDLNPEVIDWRPTLSDYEHSPNTPEQQYDREYPLYEFMEAGLTEEQFNQVAAHLLRNTRAEDLAKAPGIGIQKAREFKENLARSDAGGQATLGDFGLKGNETKQEGPAEGEEEPPLSEDGVNDKSQKLSVQLQELVEQTSKNIQEIPKEPSSGFVVNGTPIEEAFNCITYEEVIQLKKELSIDSETFDFHAKPRGPGDGKKLHSKRLHNLKLMKSDVFDVDPTLTKEEWDGKKSDNNPITKIRKENPLDYTKWKVKKTVVYQSSSGQEIAMLRPGKEAHENYETTGYKTPAVKRDDLREWILKEVDNIEPDMKKKLDENNRQVLTKSFMEEYLLEEGYEVPGSKRGKVRENQFDALPVILDGKKVIARNLVLKETEVALRDLKRDELRELILKEVDNIEPDMKKKLDENNRQVLTKSFMEEYLLEEGYEFPEPPVNEFTPWTLQHLAEALEKIKHEKCGKEAVEIIGALLVRMAYMLDHEETQNSGELIKLELPPTAIKILSRILPNGIQVTENNEFISIDSVLYLFDLLGLNEEIKVDWKGIKDLNENNGKLSPKGRVNTLLTYATFLANAINPDHLQTQTVFEYNRTQNDPRPLDFYRNSFRFLNLD